MSKITHLKVLYEDNHLIAVFKPAGVLAQEDSTDTSDLFNLTKAYLKEKYQKPGNVYLGLLHRLDKPVSGVVLFAKTSKAASRLSEQIRNRSVSKTYRALVEGQVSQKEGTLKDRLARVNDKTFVTDSGDQDASLAYRVLASSNLSSLLEIQLHTGRKHQIRAQLAHRGNPIIGDKKYGAKLDLESIALLSYSIAFEHPTLGTSCLVKVPDDIYSLQESFSWK